MNIAYTSSDAYAQYMGISLLSLLDHNRHIKDIHVYVFDMGISTENKDNIAAVARRFRRKLTFVEAGEELQTMVEQNGLTSFKGGINSYVKIFPDMFFPCKGKILLIDSDTIINGDIGSLYDTDLENHYIAAVPEITAYFRSSEDEAIIHKKQYYFNTGVLLFNLDKMRRDNFRERLLRAFLQYGKPLKLADQSLLNFAAVDGDIKPLHFTYNFNCAILSQDFDFIRSIFAKYEELGWPMRRKTLGLRRDIRVLHFLGAKRPWFKHMFVHYGRYYVKYLRRSPWRNVPRPSYATEYRASVIERLPKSLAARPVIGYPYTILCLFLEQFLKWSPLMTPRRKAMDIKNAEGSRVRERRVLTIFGVKLSFFSKSYALLTISEQDKELAKLKKRARRQRQARQALEELLTQKDQTITAQQNELTAARQRSVAQNEALQQTHRRVMELGDALWQANEHAVSIAAALGEERNRVVALQAAMDEQQQKMIGLADALQKNKERNVDLQAAVDAKQRFVGRFWPNSWLQLWHAYAAQYRQEELDRKRNQLCAGLDEESQRMVDLLIERNFHLLPEHEYEGLFLYDRKSMLADFEKRMIEDAKSFEADVRSRYFVAEGGNLEISVFSYHNGLKLLPETVTARLAGRDFIDGGALWGDSAQVMRHYGPRRVYSFEPFPESHERLLQTIEKGGLSNVTAVAQALSRVPGKKTMYCDIHPSTANFAHVKYVSGEEKDIAVTVPVTSIDAFVAAHELDVGLIKLDVEGAELETIEGALETIRACRPVLLISVYHTPQDFFEIKPLLESLGLGYRFLVRKLDYHGYIAEFMLMAYVNDKEEDDG